MEQLIKVPDIGSTNSVDVIEILVKIGDTINVDTPLITLESDKASMEIPSSQAGVVKSIQVKIGDKVQMGDVILTLEGMAEKPAAVEVAKEAPASPTPTPAPQVARASHEETINIPDIGSTNDVDVIEILVKVGDSIQVDTPLITLESDKASMEIPSDREGTVQSIMVKIGDKVNKGSAILTLSTTKSSAPLVEAPKLETTPVAAPQEELSKSMPNPVEHIPSSNAGILAGPAVRRLARVLGVDLKQVNGTGKKARIQIEDVEQYVKTRLQQPASTQTSSGFSLPSAPEIDFSQFGDIEKQELSKIKKLSGQNLHRSWLQIPHVTQFDETDITDLESFRKQQSSLLEAEGIKLTILAFITKAVSRALIQFPEFNSSLSSDGQTLILKKFINIGIAVDTPQGLVVPVIKNVEKLSIKEIAQAMAELSQKARKKALLPSDMSGGTFTISSLGGIGGTAFTPIVNHPEVAILGVSKSSMKPVFQNNNFVPRLMLPLSLSYDHRVIDGAQGARFTRYLSELLSDIRKIML